MSYDGPFPIIVKDGGTGAATLTGVVVGSGTSALTATGITQYNVLTGGASNAPNSVAPSATSGVPLISQGSSSQPAFGTAVVAGGGTGDTSFTAYAPICGGTTTTGVLQSASTGISTSGYVLTSTGSSSLPTFQAVSASGAGWIKLLTQTASSSSSIAFTSTYITSTYLNYVITYTGVIPGTNGVNFTMDMSVNNGSGYLSGNYECAMLTNSWNGASLTNSSSTTTCPLSDTSNTIASTVYVSGIIHLFGLATTSGWPSYVGQMTQGNTVGSFFGSQQAGSTSVNNIRFTMSSGNISAGSFTLYGLVD